MSGGPTSSANRAKRRHRAGIRSDGGPLVLEQLLLVLELVEDLAGELARGAKS